MAREPEVIVKLRCTLGEQLATFRQSAGLTQADLAKVAFYDRTRIAHLERGSTRADENFWKIADERCNADGVLLAAYEHLKAVKQEFETRTRQTELAKVRAKAENLRVSTSWQQPITDIDDEAAALELARRISASDVGEETLVRLEFVVDDLATAYPVTPPTALLNRLRKYLGYVTTLLDGRKTLVEHRRLLVIGGWLSLLAATVQIDLKRQHAATASLRTAVSFARQAEHNEIHAWCYETEAWRVLTDGDYPKAIELAKAAQTLASKGGSIAIQAVAQEGRAWARLGQRKETYDAIGRVQKLVSPLPKSDRPEHHYRYDPDKSVAYTATTLAWVGDPAAESYAREIIARLKPSEDVGKWPRRVAAAKLDLALTLLVTNRLDEACYSAEQAILSGRVVPSNHWRAAEIVRAVEDRKLPKAADLREAYEGLKRGSIGT
jgi:transcriptional regulator with XRE-family HTH domain